MSSIHIGNDHGGYSLAMKIVDKMIQKKLNITHHGCCSDISTDYPVFAKRVVESIQDYTGSVGILICGTGIGMSMAANRYYYQGLLCVIILHMQGLLVSIMMQMCFVCLADLWSLMTLGQ